MRRTLGYASWDVAGESYGAYLAQEVMVRDGQAIRAVVLTSPSARGFSVHAEQALSTQRAFERLFAACAAQPSCHAAFPDVEQDFYAVYDNLTKSPVPVTIARGDGQTDTIWVDGKRLVADIRDRMGPRRALAPVPLILHELREGDRLRAAREIVGDGSVPVGFADFALRGLINCDDDQTDGPAYRKTLKSVNARARPPFRRSVDEGCRDWRPRSGAPASRAPVRSDIPTLITNGYFDSLVTSDHARRMAATLAHAYIVEFPDEGHSGPALDCHRAILAQFLADPTREPDTSCIASIPAIRFDTAWPPATSR